MFLIYVSIEVPKLLSLEIKKEKLLQLNLPIFSIEFFPAKIILTPFLKSNFYIFSTYIKFSLNSATYQPNNIP